MKILLRKIYQHRWSNQNKQSTKIRLKKLIYKQKFNILKNLKANLIDKHVYIF